MPPPPPLGHGGVETCWWRREHESLLTLHLRNISTISSHRCLSLLSSATISNAILTVDDSHTIFLALLGSPGSECLDFDLADSLVSLADLDPDLRLLDALRLADPEPLSSCSGGFPEGVDGIPLIFLDELIESSSSRSRLSIRLPLKSTYKSVLLESRVPRSYIRIEIEK
jgi:hypothetical protein